MGLFDSVGGLVGLGGSAPDLKTTNLDPQTQGLINNQLQTAQKGSQYFADQTNSGLDRAASLQQPKEIAAQGDASQGYAPGTNDAIRKAYQNQAAGQLAQIKLKNSYNADFQRADYMSRLSNILSAQTQMQNQQAQMLTNIYEQNAQARGQLISSIFQLGSAGLGMYAGARTRSMSQSRGGSSLQMPQMGGSAAPPQSSYGLQDGSMNFNNNMDFAMGGN